MTLWLAIVAAGLLTYGQRLSFITLWERMHMPAWLRRALRFVPVTVLVALIVPDVLIVDGALYVSPENDRLLAGILAAGVAWRTQNVLATIVVGMAALVLLQAG